MGLSGQGRAPAALPRERYPAPTMSRCKNIESHTDPSLLYGLLTATRLRTNLT